jgi:hypothetical protein
MPTAKCPQCKHRFNYLEDEYPDICPRCGYQPPEPPGEEGVIDLDDEPDYTDPRKTGRYKLKTGNRRRYNG